MNNKLRQFVGNFIQLKYFFLTRIISLITYLPTYLLTYLLTALLSYCMQQSPSKAYLSSANQEISHILWNPKVHFRIHKCPPPVHVMIQLDPNHAPTSHFLRIHLNIILPSKSGFSKWSLFFRRIQQNPVYTSTILLTCYMPHPRHSSRFYHPNNMVLEVRLSGSSLKSFVH
jgi:hypothetical protein